MKALLIVLFFPLFCFSQADTMLTRANIKQDALMAPPRQRVARVTNLTLNTTGQAIQFVEGSSTLNVNTFPQPRWDYANTKLMANPASSVDQAYDLHFDMVVTTSVFAFIKIQMQFVIPAATPFYFPYPDLAEADRWVDVTDLSVVGTHKIPFDYPIYTNALMRANGCQIRIRYQYYNPTTGILGTLVSNFPVLNYCSLNIYAK